ncbi:hypothetical protein F5Y03DRAFT_353257 [Xylaria venustula]|nr:hypothetical protein F5Y03DRAFT_353257 [Xylaria venustula]
MVVMVVALACMCCSEAAISVGWQVAILNNSGNLKPTTTSSCPPTSQYAALDLPSAERLQGTGPASDPLLPVPPGLCCLHVGTYMYLL